ncbi:exodeoxyribonuclease VII large subunit [Butyricicoccus pullicaecorum]|uniref:exodeoxyribonuclease VII large subunit n=1 Tax=Butyricicoccus pullicaecorum TaxID=501571 RepID=UPI003522B003
MIYTVTQLNQQIKGMLESNPSFRNIFVQGEISNYKQHTSGHHYMTLKDADGAISAVLFRADAARLRFRLMNGMKVIARGRVSSFPKTGQVQLYLADLMPDGTGALHLAFEQLKAKLYAEGLFDQSHKQEIPRMPHTIALVTSPTGAAVRDMIRILGRRYPLAKVQLWPVLVQGENAAADIAKTIARVNAHGQADVMIVGRGGGSLEDLWAFNEEIVARAIYNSKIPVISAVGHEPDVTIADFVADLRAPTPSGAAELAVPDRGELSILIDREQERLMTALENRLNGLANRLQAQENRLARCTPAQYVAERRRRTEELIERMRLAQRRKIDSLKTSFSYHEKKLRDMPDILLERRRGKLQSLSGQLDALSPLRVLARGFSVVTDAQNKIITDSADLQTGDAVTLRFAQGTAKAQITSVQKSRK